MFLEYQLLNGHDVKAFNDHDEALAEAEARHLKLAEYGDVYGSDISYAYWNDSGDRYDDETIIAYYTFNKQGRPVPLEENELRRRLFY